MRSSICPLSVLLILVLIAGVTRADIAMIISDDGTDLTMTAFGSYDLTTASPGNSGASLGVNAGVAPNFGLYGWDPVATASYVVSYSGNLTGVAAAFPADFTTTTNPFFFSVSESLIYFGHDASLVGTVNETAIFEGVTLASLGMVPGETVTVTWDGDSATISTVGALGDVDLNGDVNLLDVNEFIERLSTGTYQYEADCNEDGEVNLLDVDFFIAILGGD